MSTVDRPTVGLAVPYWRHPHYLAEVLASIAAQTDRDFVAVVVDDGAPVAGAREAVEALGDPRVRYERNGRNLGLAGNFNRCLAAPGTDVVALVHADDLLEPGYVATIRAAHADAPHAACVAPWTTPIDAAGQVAMSLVDRLKHSRWPAQQRSELVGDAGLARLVHTFFVYTPAVSYRPAPLPGGGFPEGWQQVMDVQLYADLLLGGGTILLDRTPAYRYRRHPDTATSRNARTFTRFAEETEMCRRIAVAAQAQGWERTRRAARLRWSIRLNGLVAVATSIGRRAPGRARALRDVVSPR